LTEKCSALLEAPHSNEHKALFISSNMLYFGVQKFSFATFRSIIN